jgi:putative ABC transport system permease protein
VGAMTRVPLGVAPTNVVLAGVQLPAGFNSDAWTKVAGEHALILDRLRAQPGVLSAGSTNDLPFEHGWRNPFEPVDQTFARPEDRPQAQYHSVSDGYFETMGARVIDGRAFTPSDTPDGEAVVIVNETLARRHYPGRSAVGREIVSTPTQVGPLARNLTWTVNKDGSRTPPARTRIVGVVADIQNVPLGTPVEPAVYAPARQFPFGSVTIAVAARDVGTAVQAVRHALKDVSPQTPLGTVETWDDRLASRTAEPRLLMTTLTAFGALAAFLAALGIYGLFSWSVALRRRELAIRLTLGERPRSVALAVVRRSAVLVGIGLAAGVALVQTARGLLSTVLFGVTPHDSTAVAAGAVLLFAVAVVASLPPAWRAMRVDPVEGLRSE